MYGALSKIEEKDQALTRRYSLTTSPLCLSHLWKSSRNIFNSYLILWKDWLKTCLCHCLVERRKGPSKIFSRQAEYDEEEGPYFTFNKAYERSFKGLQNLTGSCLSCEANTALSEYTPAWRYSQDIRHREEQWLGPHSSTCFGPGGTLQDSVCDITICVHSNLNGHISIAKVIPSKANTRGPAERKQTSLSKGKFILSCYRHVWFIH